MKLNRDREEETEDLRLINILVGGYVQQYHYSLFRHLGLLPFSQFLHVWDYRVV